jgi:signal transduction histidine kinase
MDSLTTAPLRETRPVTREHMQPRIECSRNSSGQCPREFALAERLHDDAAQLLSLATMQLDAALSTQVQDTQLAVSHARVLVRQAMTALRTAIASVPTQAGDEDQPPYLDLSSELQEMLIVLSAQSGQRIDFHSAPDANGIRLQAISAPSARVLIDAAKELATNACKHARGSAITVTLAACAEGLALSVRDRGPGFTGPLGMQFGLPLLHRRLTAIGARVCFTSDAPSGVHARVFLPWA